MTEPQAMEQAPDIGAVHAHTTHLQFYAKLIQRQFAGLGQSQADKLGMRLKLAAAHMALPRASSEPVCRRRLIRLFTKRGETRKWRAASR